MRWEGYIDYEETRRAIKLLQAPDEVFEIRVIGTASRKDIISGYFQDTDILFEKLDTIDLRKRNVYITLGEVREECFSRSQCNRFEKNPAVTTNDNDMIARRWFFVDTEYVRPTRISSCGQRFHHG